MVDMVNQAKAQGYKFFFITGRGDSQHQATIANLENDLAAGYPADLTTATTSGVTVPEIDAGYPAPTGLDSGHGGFADGLFTKPPVGSYPAYLDKPEFCGPYIHATPAVSCPTIQYKSGTRAYIESQGYDIVANSATSSAISKVASRTRRSRCRTRTTTSRRRGLEQKSSRHPPLPFATPVREGAANSCVS